MIRGDRLLTAGEWRAKMTLALRDRSYRATPLGTVVGRYYRWKKNEWGATDATMVEYEMPLARLAVFYSDLEVSDFEPPIGTERIREFNEYHWGTLSASTRSKVLSIERDFFGWCIDNQLIHGDPTRAIRHPRKREKVRELFSQRFVAELLAAQTYPADRIACELICIYGLRKGEVRGVQLKHFDFDRRQLAVLGKGGKVRYIPIADDAFWLKVGEFQVEAQVGIDDYLLYRYANRRCIVPLDEAEETLTIKGETTGYGHREAHDHSEQVSKSVGHSWWYRCLIRAGLVEPGTNSGANMHRGRHTAITDLLRTPGVNLKHAQLLAGHEKSETTANIYAHFDTEDLAWALTKRLERD